MFDALIVGGGPAGLNAAMMLGRVRRPVLLVDSGHPRNLASPSMHGFLSRDGADPAEVLRAGRAELDRYPSIETWETQITDVVSEDGRFRAITANGKEAESRRVLLATGVTDELPAIEGLAPLWGRGVYHCPYCHGWEVRDQQVAVLGDDDDAADLALTLARLGCQVTLLAAGLLGVGDDVQHALVKHGVDARPDQLLRVEGQPGALTLRLASGDTLERHALFVHAPRRQHSDLACRLGCSLFDDGSVEVNELGQTTVPGVYAAGDMCRTPAMPGPAAQVIMAAAQGARAAVVIDKELAFTDLYAQDNDASSPGSVPFTANTR
jgi:thioredoxin reductase